MHMGLRSALFGSALPLAGFELGMDFKNGWYRSGAVVTRDLAAMPGYSFARAGAKFEDVGGVLVPVAGNAPAIVPGVGFIARPGYTNLISNSTATGAAPGVNATRWLNTGGQTQAVVGVGTENGLPYVDVRIAWDGTQTTTRFAQIIPGSTADYPAAAQGDVFAASAYVRLVSGAWPVSGGAGFQLREFDSANAFVTTRAENIKPVGNAAQRVISSRALAGASTAKVYSTIEISANAGEVVDLTLRVYGWSLVKSSIVGPYIPTTAGAVQIAQDDMRLSLPTMSDGDWVIMAAVNFASGASSLERPLVANDGTAQNRVMLERSPTGQLNAAVVLNGVFQNIPQPTAVQAGSGKGIIALRRRAGRYSVIARNSTGTTSFSAESAVIGMPPGISLVSPIANGGSFPGSSPINGAHEFLGYRRVTSSDEQVAGMLAALA